MQYIDKALHEEEGNQVTENYLNAICTENAGNRTYNVSYKTFRWLNGHRYVNDMAEVLVRNQNGYCCYCMRRITGNHDVTLEHILPQSEKDADYYQRCPLLDNRHIKMTSVFNDTENPIFPPYPHIVSYNNLVASCRGLFPRLNNDDERITDKPHSCNNKRKEAKAFPIYYLNTVKSLISYSKQDGKAYEATPSAYQQETRELILSANLNWETLTDIRFMWALMKNEEMTEIQSCTSDIVKRKMFLYRLLKNKKYDSVRKNLNTKFEKNLYWDTLMLYDWFYNYNWA